MAYNTRRKLFPEEEKMPLAKYFYEYPMHDLPDDVKEKIFGPPMDPKDAIRVQNLTDWLLPIGEYTNHENGYCMFEDGSGYIATYMVIPENVDTKKMFWYMRWLNIHSKSMVLGHGNLRYKIWNPADHFDHYFINWTDGSDGIFTTESLDLGEGDPLYNTIRHRYKLREFGLTDEKVAALEASGLKVNEEAGWESFDEPGAHTTLAQIRPRPEGGHERRSVEWIGWRPAKDGKLVREPRTYCDEDYLRKVAQHTLIEWYHMMTFINDLYDEYHDQPIDAD